jgi:MFS family permease
VKQHSSKRRGSLLRALRGLPRPAIVLLTGVAVNRMGSLLQIFLVLYLTDGGFSPVQAGAVLGCYGFGSILGDFLGGTTSDRIGPRRTILVSMSVSAVLIGAVPYLRSYAALMVVCFLIGMITHLYWPAALAMLACLTPANRLVITSSALRFAINVGATVAPLLGVFLATRSYTLMFLADATTSLLFAIVAAFLLPEATQATAESRSVVGPDGRRPGGYLTVLSDRRFVVVAAAALAAGLAEAQYLSALPLRIEASGLPAGLYGAVLAINGAMVIFFELPLTPLVQRVPMQVSMAIGSALTGFGIAMFGVPAGPWPFIVGAVVWTVGEMVSMPSTLAYPALIAPPDLRGRYISVLTTCQNFGFAVGPVIGTALYEVAGATIWILCLVLGVIAGIGMWVGVVNPGGPSEAHSQTHAVGQPLVEGDQSGAIDGHSLRAGGVPE